MTRPHAECAEGKKPDGAGGLGPGRGQMEGTQEIREERKDLTRVVATVCHQMAREGGSLEIREIVCLRSTYY